MLIFPAAIKRKIARFPTHLSPVRYLIPTSSKMFNEASTVTYTHINDRIKPSEMPKSKNKASGKGKQMENRFSG